MKIKFKSFSRHALGKYRPGTIVDLPDVEALIFLKKGYAWPVKNNVVCDYETTELPVNEMMETAAAEIAAVPVIETTITIPEIISKKKKKKKKR